MRLTTHPSSVQLPAVELEQPAAMTQEGENAELPPPAPLAMPVQRVRTVGGLLESAAEMPGRLIGILSFRRSLPKPR